MTSTTMTTMEYTTANSTTGDSLYGGVNLTLMTQVLNILILVFLMISMGVAIDLQDFKETFRRPVAFFIGMGSQFVLMPLIGFCLGLAFKLETAAAISVLILACCPGGTLSNLFTFLADGDVCLSVSMTTISTAVAIGMMPLNLFIYTRVWTSETAVIPYVNIVTTLVSILIPAAFGVLLRWWKKELAKWVTRIGVVAALLCVVITFVISILLNPNIFNVGWQLWLCAGILPMLGYAIGYGFALVFRQSHVKCRTIAFETGSQNVSLALTLTVLTFAESPLFLDMLFYPSLYAVFIYSESFVVLVVYRLVKHLRKRGEDDAEEIVKDTEATKMDVIDSAPKNMARDSNMGCSQDVEIESEYAPRTDINSQPDKQ
ncbi:ileal sodium/bile acid cotransporter-like [Diadema setosum]|uniref:ileal sodium/bile acid cotransporter-like n=1 Tax=Diadema setosum TaxID=31175 RepID=UPI003B3A8D88